MICVSKNINDLFLKDFLGERPSCSDIRNRVIRVNSRTQAKQICAKHYAYFDKLTKFKLLYLNASVKYIIFFQFFLQICFPS